MRARQSRGCVFACAMIGREVLGESEVEMSSVVAESRLKKRRVLQLIEVGTGDIAMEIDNLNDLTTFDFSRNGRYLVTGSSKGTVTVWVIGGTIRTSISQVLDSMTLNSNFWNNYPLYLPIEGAEEKQFYDIEKIEDKEAEDQVEEAIQPKDKEKAVPVAFSKTVRSFVDHSGRQPLYKPLAETYSKKYVHPPQQFKPIDHFKPPPSRTQPLKIIQGSKPEVNLAEESKRFQRPYTFYKTTKNLYEIRQNIVSPVSGLSERGERVLAHREAEPEVTPKDAGDRKALYTSQEDAMAVLLGRQEDKAESVKHSEQVKEYQIAPDPEDIDQEEDDEGKKSVSAIDSASGCDVIDNMYQDIQNFEEKHRKAFEP
eukprot:TRINITY_DN5649_c0_g2_i1.p1 TRINITY_DN5649_c0_g2~~TRINITY_DN5649_c0_g2_i1.p1  ORF type:complete len:370 (-),score=75.13 TRINITY_DN5649_c0_g2_i1:68-1177(-)